jgi:hypothetical protein
MPANTSPIFPLTPVTTWGTLTAANTAVDGTGTVATIFTAGTDGGRVDYIKARALGTNVTTVVRVFINNGSVNSTATNNSLITEAVLPATTASNSTEIGADVVIPLNISIPNGYKINVCIGTAVSAGWQFTAVGGNY